MHQVDAIQMGTHNICLYKEVDKNYTGCNLKTMQLLDCALIGVCAVIRWNMVVKKVSYEKLKNPSSLIRTYAVHLPYLPQILGHLNSLAYLS